MAFILKSAAFENGGRMPRKYSGLGEELSPPLAWIGLPSGTRELALICEDLDTPVTITHWVLYGILVNIPGIPEGTSSSPSLCPGAIQGKRSFGKAEYMGPAPLGKKSHRYSFKIYALDRPLGLGAGTSRKALEKAMSGHVLGVAELVGKFARD
jgi:Raf kinase inhibitor-like YbhB/YbcL family protein